MQANEINTIISNEENLYNLNLKLQTCIVCYEKLFDKQPKTCIYCFNNICNNCVDKIKDKTNNVFKCPCCRKILDLH